MKREALRRVRAAEAAADWHSETGTTQIEGECLNRLTLYSCYCTGHVVYKNTRTDEQRTPLRMHPHLLVRPVYGRGRCRSALALFCHFCDTHFAALSRGHGRHCLVSLLTLLPSICSRMPNLLQGGHAQRTLEL